MQILSSFLIALLVAIFCNAQQTGSRSVKAPASTEIEGNDTNEPNAGEVLEADPGGAALEAMNAGLAHYYEKDYEKAVEGFLEAQQLAPEDAVTNNNLGFAYLFAGQYQHAIGSFQTALRIDPRFSAAKNGLCGAAALNQNPDAVAICLTAVSSIPDSAVPLYFLGVAYMNANEDEKGLSAFKQAVHLEPQTAKIHVGLGFASLKLTRYREALKYFEDARKLDRKVKHALVGMGATYAQLKDFKKAESVLRAAVTAEPDNATARFNLGMVCLARRNRDCALSQYNRLKMMHQSLADKLFKSMFRNRVVNASGNNKR